MSVKKIWSRCVRNWHYICFWGVLLVQAAVFWVFRENSYIAVHDNLDLFMGHFQVMKRWDGFFGLEKILPMLGGISRDYLSSEFSLYNILFYLLPPFTAYMIGYFLKILIAAGSALLLVRDVYGKEGYRKYEPVAVLSGLAYGLLPLFPAYGIAFASIPLVIVLLRRIYAGKSPWYYLALFAYPLVSYFSYFGIFILGYLAVALVVVAIRDKKWNLRLTGALFVLAAGYVVFEYRLFGQMLFSDVETIRATMTESSLTAGGIAASIWDVFCNAIFHAQPSHTRFLLPLCLIFFVLQAAGFLRAGRPGRILTDRFNQVMYFIVGNCVVYGLYYWGGLRELVEKLVPPLKGFQFNRTVFFNPFLWYAAAFLLFKALYDSGRKRRIYLANLCACAMLAVVILTPAVYNDFYHTCYYHAYRIVKHTEVDALNYREFYSVELFERIKDQIGYDGEYAAAYGMHPAVLSYNGIATLDGYLGFYPQSYKDRFAAMVKPATDRVEEWRTYYGDWGARAYLFSGSGENTWNAVRSMNVSDPNLYIDGDVFRELSGRYLFSRFEIANAETLGFTLLDVFEDETSPYTIYVYETLS